MATSLHSPQMAEQVVKQIQTRPKKMVPSKSVPVTVEEVALQIFTRIYMDSAGYNVERYVKSAFDAAEEFVNFAEARRNS